ncbi:hypothetical protein ADUPG1_007963 [Aduncisulcus paluster]|uniref:Uncharacterized protein n=1 Tax=Aduncisulcus paluster TaxID=2918883 RepID=A0ABQ5KSR9_9EUKA|nr:hypothetical protein ADUPG1_007963 [Aduncisulcus paluster]
MGEKVKNRVLGIFMMDNRKIGAEFSDESSVSDGDFTGASFIETRVEGGADSQQKSFSDEVSNPEIYYSVPTVPIGTKSLYSSEPDIDSVDSQNSSHHGGKKVSGGKQFFKKHETKQIELGPTRVNNSEPETAGRKSSPDTTASISFSKKVGTYFSKFKSIFEPTAGGAQENGGSHGASVRGPKTPNFLAKHYGHYDDIDSGSSSILSGSIFSNISKMVNNTFNWHKFPVVGLILCILFSIVVVFVCDMLNLLMKIVFYILYIPAFILKNIFFARITLICIYMLFSGVLVSILTTPLISHFFLRNRDVYDKTKLNSHHKKLLRSIISPDAVLKKKELETRANRNLSKKSTESNGHSELIDDESSDQSNEFYPTPKIPFISQSGTAQRIFGILANITPTSSLSLFWRIFKLIPIEKLRIFAKHILRLFWMSLLHIADVLNSGFSLLAWNARVSIGAFFVSALMLVFMLCLAVVFPNGSQCCMSVFYVIILVGCFKVIRYDRERKRREEEEKEQWRQERIARKEMRKKQEEEEKKIRERERERQIREEERKLVLQTLRQEGLLRERDEQIEEEEESLGEYSEDSIPEPRPYIPSHRKKSTSPKEIEKHFEQKTPSFFSKVFQMFRRK